MIKTLAALLLCLGPARAAVIRLPASLGPTAPSIPAPAWNPLASPSLSLPPPALSPSLSPSPSAAAAPVPGAPAPLPARSLNDFWDGLDVEAPELAEPSFAALPLAAPADGPIGPPERLAPWLETDDAKIAAALDRAVEIARSTRSGRRALEAAEKTLEGAGRTLPVLVLGLGRNHGEYDYVEKNVRLHSALFKRGREAELAGTLVHELVHVTQHGQGAPSNALEMEIEAHLTDLEMLAELGASPREGTFARQALDYLALGPDKFVELLQAAVPGTIFLGESSLDEIEDQLEEDLASLRRRAKRSKSAARLVPVVERDLARLRSPEGAAAYRAFSKRVMALLRRRAGAAR